MTNQQAPRPVHSTAFAGISGVAFPTEQTSGPGNSVRAVALPNGALLLDPAGRWALRLHKLQAESAHVLLQVLRDLAPAATQQDSTLVRRVAVYDDACAKDTQLASQIRESMQLLNSLALKLTKRRYLEIDERAMRRNLLMQLAEVSFFTRLGVPGGVNSMAMASAT